MRMNSFQTFTAAALLITLSMVLVNGSAPDTTLQDVAGYRQWTRVNSQPIPVPTIPTAGSPITFEVGSLGGD